MLIGVPKEIKNHEYRVGLTPAGTLEMIKNGHSVIVETNAGCGIGFSDEDYISAGAKIITGAKEIFDTADMIIKVKEPQAVECAMLRKDQLLFTYLHLAPDPKQTELLIKSGCVALAYETVTDNAGRLPLLAPMSEVAGRMSIQAGMHCLEKAQGGSGVLLAGVPGVAPGKVTIIGGGFVGENAARMAMGVGADVTILDRSLSRLKELDTQYGPTLKTRYSDMATLMELIKDSDLVIGAVLIPGASAPKLITKAMLSTMKKGSVLVDVAIDQGGCFETSHATTHQDPTYVVDDIIHYCVANMPGGVARTATLALTNATLPFAISLANKGWKQACRDNEHLRNGLNVVNGQVTYKAVCDVLGYDYVNADTILA